MKRKHLLGNRIFMALVFVFLYAPIFILIIFSFNAGNSSAVWKGFSLHWYAELFQNRLIMQSVYTTLLVSVLSTLIATVAGTFAAIGLASMRRRWRTPLMTVNNIPVMNAEIVTGVSMCLLFVAFSACGRPLPSGSTRRRIPSGWRRTSILASVHCCWPM